ncbi:phage tail protein [Stutzerimonas nitrititolerans]|uniref:phage tail protein n=1 Tax=Stutzerimonas nitrititolerans TaxID=2482751 RepID=UPI0028AAC5C2|nr:phage tail protein [Stutzerimonas nitrititolerans]
MKYYKHKKTGEIFAYEDQDERNKFGSESLLVMTPEEVTSHLEKSGITVDDLCANIDTAADTARARVAGDPLRAVEYDRARIAAEQFAAAGYQGDVPPMVAAWAINGRTAQEAADDILHEAAQYTAALIALRETRLAAKEQVRALMDAGEVEQAQQVVEQTVAAIEAAVAGVGNAA